MQRKKLYSAARLQVVGVNVFLLFLSKVVLLRLIAETIT